MGRLKVAQDEVRCFCEPVLGYEPPKGFLSPGGTVELFPHALSAGRRNRYKKIVVFATDGTYNSGP